MLSMYEDFGKFLKVWLHIAVSGHMPVGPISISSQKNLSGPAEICLLQFFLVIGSKVLQKKTLLEKNDFTSE